MRRRVLFTLLAGAAAAFAIASSASPREIRSAAPPSGLTTYGRAVWNLDALLHDTFGRRQVYLNVRRSYPRTPANFSTQSLSLAQSRIVLYTFSDARHSAFTLARPVQPPRPDIGASGWDALLTMRGAYISCGGGKWLYEHGGEALANWWVGCRRSL